MNKTQCPHCVTDYVISDEQLRLSQGKVRCGNCLEYFDAYSELNKEKAIFDPRDAFMEPLSYYEEEHAGPGVDDILPDARSLEFKDPSLAGVAVGKINNLSKKIENETDQGDGKLQLGEILKEQSSTHIKSEDSIAIISGEPLRPKPNAGALSSLANNFDPELSVNLDDDDFSENISIDENPSVENSTRFLEPSTAIESSHVSEASVQFGDNDIEEPSIQLVDLESPKQTLVPDPNQRLEPQLVEKPLTQSEIDLRGVEPDDIELPSETIMVEDDDIIEDPFEELNDDQEFTIADYIDLENDNDLFASTLAKKSITKRIFTWFMVPVFLTLIALLAVSFTYQLWQKQIISWPDREDVRAQLDPVTTPFLSKLEELNVELPERRNLRSLQLLSATTQAHPTRSSTILLRVSLVNRAAIEQPLPWLELSLNNSEGKMISRRSLSPSDYIHNNRIDTSIKPNELKKVTIELLSFPKHAAGFELRLLNK